MRAARYHGREDLRLEDVPEPSPGAGDVKLRVLYAGICGTDIHEVYDGPVFVPVERPHPLTGVQAPVILGHELCGEVVEVGAGVTTVAPGDLVAVEPLQPCGRCAYCTSGAYNLCPTRAAHGLARAGGGFAEFTVVEERMAHGLPPGLSAIQGALVEPMSVGVHAVKLTHARPGSWVAVHGLGPIGLGVLLALRARGVETIASDPSARRRSAVEAVGFRHVLDPRQAMPPTRSVRSPTAGASRRPSTPQARRRRSRPRSRAPPCTAGSSSSRCRSSLSRCRSRPFAGTR